MNTVKRLLTGVAGLLVCLSALAEDVQLPNKSPELAATAQEQLGTLADDVGLAKGSVVSDFSVKNIEGEKVDWTTLKNDAPLLVVFYRGGWCPYCNVQIRQLTEAWPEFEKRGVTPILISADKPDAAALAARTYEIPFPVLSDPDLNAHDAFNVTMELPEHLVPVYKDYGIVVEDWNGAGHRKFAVSSAFIVDGKGAVLWANSSLDYKTRPSPQQLLQVIDQL
ncbi:AhpC/TSA family protein [Gilvimarinus agarilyticus]|uniref:peroxiredoxin-like family protein n=1 Tax=Gilvimarinus sp. 2_MG-2023 TaxID=3062666 RepID=UPI001C09F634|nr:peroxiredoxin-like family protein [Gilvimarinus sp. 2_MG-2023]MBU2887495.1 AhpC/TSA family protein [Gilvimarinus agarilyticus]MDO6572146.1 peroxiredoxin-like family protein [Gilvimarinus sp. 2_MG-2023]